LKPTIAGLVWLLHCALPGGPSAAEGRRFVLDVSRSSLTVRTGRGGLFSFAGHEHVIVASGIRGEILADATSLASSSVSVTVDAASLRVQAEGEPAEDVPKVQARMAGPELLDVTRFPEIVFRSTGVSGKSAGAGSFDLLVSGDVSLHGATRQRAFQVHVEVSGDTLTATGRCTLRQSTFGLEPISVAGVVKVKDDVVVDYKFVGIAAP
jgi:polyisoprenoid-binding protein YceI